LTKNYALTDDGKGGVLAHRADCMEVRAAADRGEPVLSLYDCQGELPANLVRHSCLQKPDEK
jgi:hypothetical protein